MIRGTKIGHPEMSWLILVPTEVGILVITSANCISVYDVV